MNREFAESSVRGQREAADRLIAGQQECNESTKALVDMYHEGNLGLVKALNQITNTLDIMRNSNQRFGT